MSDPVVNDPRGRDQRAAPLLRRLLGEVLRRTRQHQGRTLSDVAGHANVSMPYLSEVERGRKEASSEVLAAICEALRIDLSDLLAEVGRDLVRDPARRAPGVRPEVARDPRRAPSQARGRRGGAAGPQASVSQANVPRANVPQLLAA